MDQNITEDITDTHPVTQFSRWFDVAKERDEPMTNAMSLATVAADGRPSLRIVLLKQFDDRGFVWFSNYASRKGEELAQHPHAALLFHWVQLERQVRIEGRVERLSASENDAYFQSRPLGSRISAIVSHQSQPIESRALLEERYAQTLATCGEHPPCPATWGGYLLIPDRMEFWQGRPSRLHDRIVYILESNGTWRQGRLQP